MFAIRRVPFLARNSVGIARCALSEQPAKLTDQQRKDIQSKVDSAPVVVFMKGTQEQPMCGFSRNVKLVLDHYEIPFKDYNVLEDEELRAGIKIFSDWPTIPQVYAKGEFVGGCDILIEMHRKDEITDYFKQRGVRTKSGGQKT